MILYRFIIIAGTFLLGGCGTDLLQKDDQDRESQSQPVRSDRRLEDLATTNSTLTNLPQIINVLSLRQLHRQGALGQDVTIAILDNGFAGLATSLGKRLPPDLRVEHAPKNKPADEQHGTKMAEIVYAVATGSVNYSTSRPGPNILLYNTNGYSNFVHAIDDVIARKVDIVLYAQIWEFGGNGDGAGFINAQVNRATNAGILWINAAGNYGKTTYSGRLAIGQNNYITLPHNNRFVRLKVDESTQAKISLGWNDFRETINHRTKQDLDLELFSAEGRKLSESTLVQDGGAAPTRAGAKYAHAREVIITNLAAGEYHIAVKAMSRNFNAQSRLWVAVNGPFLSVLDRGDNNSVFIPADNPSVLTVGASDVDFSSSRSSEFGEPKPEFVNFSRVNFDDGKSYAGTSAASGIATGALAAIMSSGRLGKLSRQEVIDLFEQQKISVASMSLGQDRPATPILRLPVLE